mmetsp:Transcript_53332/g.114002  ORF Transcript_53332/g.114002 Transcript_53332/m.114002 type:complete len:222 (-) Transcript_53332:145-810(-)
MGCHMIFPATFAITTTRTTPPFQSKMAGLQPRCSPGRLPSGRGAPPQRRLRRRLGARVPSRAYHHPELDPEAVDGHLLSAELPPVRHPLRGPEEARRARPRRLHQVGQGQARVQHSQGTAPEAHKQGEIPLPPDLRGGGLPGQLRRSYPQGRPRQLRRLLLSHFRPRATCPHDVQRACRWRRNQVRRGFLSETPALHAVAMIEFEPGRLHLYRCLLFLLCA